MVSEKALYWMSVAVLAIGVSNHFALKGDVASEIAARTSAFAERALDRGAEYATYVGVALSRASTCPTARPVVATTPVRLARLQSTLACERAGFGRLQAEKAQLFAAQQIRMTEMKMRMQNVRVEVPNVVVEASY